MEVHAILTEQQEAHWSLSNTQVRGKLRKEGPQMAQERAPPIPMLQM